MSPSSPNFSQPFIVDGQKPSLICCTVGGKVFVHSPHEGHFEGNVGNE